jgi:hypothetical protein
LDDEGGAPDVAMDPPGAARKAGLGSEMFFMNPLVRPCCRGCPRWL